LTNKHYPIHTCPTSSSCGITVATLTASSTGDLAPFMPPVPASFSVTSAATQAIYISTSGGNGYEILYPTQIAGYAPNAGCAPADIISFGENAGCMGMNVASSLYIAGGGGPSVTLSIAPLGNFGPAQNGINVTLTWSSSSALSCSLTGDSTSIFSGFLGGHLSGTLGFITQQFSYNDDSSGTIIVTCYTNANWTGTSGTGNVTVTVTGS
jgi:hypothetical protein